MSEIEEGDHVVVTDSFKSIEGDPQDGLVQVAGIVDSYAEEFEKADQRRWLVRFNHDVARYVPEECLLRYELLVD